MIDIPYYDEPHNRLMAENVLQNGDVRNVDVRFQNYYDGSILNNYTFDFKHGILVLVNDSSYGGSLTLHNGLPSGVPILYRLRFTRNSSDTLSKLDYIYLGQLSFMYEIEVDSYEISFIIAQ